MSDVAAPGGGLRRGSLRVGDLVGELEQHRIMCRPDDGEAALASGPEEEVPRGHALPLSGRECADPPAKLLPEADVLERTHARHAPL